MKHCFWAWVHSIRILPSKEGKMIQIKAHNVSLGVDSSQEGAGTYSVLFEIHSDDPKSCPKIAERLRVTIETV